MPITLNTLNKLKASGQKITMLTCYDSSFAQLFDSAGIESLLVGDSLGMVIQGHDSTIPVTLEEVVYHTKNVARATKNSLLIADLPFGSYQRDERQAFDSCVEVIKAGAKVVKIEGGFEMLQTVRYLTERDINVFIHLGFRPQAVNSIGLKIQGRDNSDLLKAQALEFESAGAKMILLEMVSQSVAKEITESVSIPVIGIGAGPNCDGQVLVCYDAFGIYQGKRPRFSHDFLSTSGDMKSAVFNYILAVKNSGFPAPEHCFD